MSESPLSSLSLLIKERLPYDLIRLRMMFFLFSCFSSLNSESLLLSASISVCDLTGFGAGAGADDLPPKLNVNLFSSHSLLKL